MNDVITFRGDREPWLDFVHRLRKDKKKVWVVLRPFVKKYSMCDEQTRLLLVLFPKNFVDKLLEKDDPDRFIQEAIQERLASQE